MNKFRFHTTQLTSLIHGLKLKPGRIFSLFVPYYFLTIVCALLEGVSMMLLVALFTSGADFLSKSGLPEVVLDPLQALLGEQQLPSLVLVLLSVFGSVLIIRFGLIYFDGVISAVLRRKVQESIFRSYLNGDWAHMRNFRVGDAVGTNTQEAMIVAKYMLSAVATLYFLFGAIVMSGLALRASTEVTLVLGCIALPIMLLMQKVFSVQARLSRKSAALRNEFSGDITDRFNGLLQIHVDKNLDYHLEKGLHTQSELTSLDIKIGACQAAIGSFNFLLIFTSLLGFVIWLKFFGAGQIPDLGLIASVGVLGIRVASQLNGVVASIGNISRLSGSVYPVLAAMNVPPSLTRKSISEPVMGIDASSISYTYGELKVVDGLSLSVKRKEPLVLCGRSGRGKTTLANLLAGLYFPVDGEVYYIGESGERYSSRLYSAKVGFVTQDIYLFRGTLRDNLTSGRECIDEEIWSVLDQVDAADFVRLLGGLETESAEAGRSLSGGQRRRLGVARVLLSGADILIFDEVTAGLDQENKSAVIGVIDSLSEHYAIVLVSHDPLALAGQTTFTV